MVATACVWAIRRRNGPSRQNIDCVGYPYPPSRHLVSDPTYTEGFSQIYLIFFPRFFLIACGIKRQLYSEIVASGKTRVQPTGLNVLF